VLLELGPVPADIVRNWTRFARRMMCELRHDPAELASLAVADLLGPWDRLIDDWERTAQSPEAFRWSGELDDEQAEYLLFGYERFLSSPTLLERATRSELIEHRPFSVHVARAFIDAMETAGCCDDTFAGEVRELLGHRLAR
jgi:hypothetical protein